MNEASSQSSASVAKNGPVQHALIIDDEAVLAQSIASILEQLGYQPDIALNGKEALERTRTQQYALIICDLLVPGLNGMALYEIWQKEAPHLTSQIIFMTGDSFGGETSEFLRRTKTRYIFKPFRLNDLVDIVRQVQANNASGVAPSPTKEKA